MNQYLAGISAAALVGAIIALSQIKKALEALQIIPVFHEGQQAIWAEADPGLYVIAVVMIAVSIMLPLGLINALAEA